MKTGWLLTLLGLILLTQGCASPPEAESTSTPDVAALVEATLTALAAEIPATQTPTAPQWTTGTAELFGFTFDLPPDWTITEINRRPEAIDDPLAPAMGHDCADYLIASPDGSQQLYLYPACGYADGSGDTCPVDTALLETRGETGVIVRYQDQATGRYIFSEARFATLLSNSGETKKMLCFRPPVMVFETPTFTHFVRVEYQYNGLPENLEAALAVVDRMVTSLALR